MTIGPYRWAEYIAVFVDFLGQTSQFKRIQDFFIADVSQETLDDVAENTVGVVDCIREMLNELFEWSAMLVPPKIRVSDQDRDEYNRSRATSPITYRFFSDGILAFIELRATGYQLNDWFAIHDLYISLGGALLGTLAIESSFRAAIELGIGTRLKDGDLYGPIRAEIHELEKNADYPRIVIGKRFLEYMKLFAEGHPRIPCLSEKESIGCQDVANYCLKMTAADPNDGRLILDYLGGDFILRNDFLSRNVYSEARKYMEHVLQERGLYENDEVFRKFRKLRNYFNSRPSRA